MTHKTRTAEIRTYCKCCGEYANNVLSAQKLYKFSTLVFPVVDWLIRYGNKWKRRLLKPWMRWIILKFNQIQIASDIAFQNNTKFVVYVELFLSTSRCFCSDYCFVLQGFLIIKIRLRTWKAKFSNVVCIILIGEFPRHCTNINATIRGGKNAEAASRNCQPPAWRPCHRHLPAVAGGGDPVDD